MLGTAVVCQGQVQRLLADWLHIGSVDEKLELCFKAFDSKSKGYLTFKEVSKLVVIISR